MTELTKQQLLEKSLLLLDENDRHRIRSLAQILVWQVPIKSREHTGHAAPFGPKMSYELLYEIGRVLNGSD